MKFEHNGFGRQLRTMLRVDFRRMFTMPLIYILLGTALSMPILILVMTTMMDGSVSVDPVTGAETVLHGFDSTWQVIGTVSGAGAGAAMDMTSMCNINLIYFAAAVLVCLFIGDDFRSGYAKNLFTVRAVRTDYVVSKTAVCMVGGVLMMLAFFAGAVLGGAIAGLPAELSVGGVFGLVLCMVCKCLLLAVFVPIFVVMSVIGRQRVWMSILGSLFAGMLLFMMVPMLTPLNADLMNVLLCAAGGAMFCFGLGLVSSRILKKSDLV